MNPVHAQTNQRLRQHQTMSSMKQNESVKSKEEDDRGKNECNDDNGGGYGDGDDSNNDDDRNRRLQDHGWAWMTVLGCFLAHLITGGLERSDGVFFLKLTARYGDNAQVTAWAGALTATIMMIMGPVASAISSRYSGRTSVMCGSFLYSVGLICSGLAPNMAALIVCFGVVQGLGRGLTYAPGPVIVGTYFKRRRGLAMGIATAGVGVGTFLLPPLVQVLFEEFGFSGAFLILGGIALNFSVVAMLYRPFFVHTSIVLKQREKERKGRVEKSPTGQCRCCRCWLGWKKPQRGTSGGGGDGSCGHCNDRPLLLRSFTMAADPVVSSHNGDVLPVLQGEEIVTSTGRERGSNKDCAGDAVEEMEGAASDYSAGANATIAPATSVVAVAVSWNLQPLDDRQHETGISPVQLQQTEPGCQNTRQSQLTDCSTTDLTKTGSQSIHQTEPNGLTIKPGDWFVQHVTDPNDGTTQQREPDFQTLQHAEPAISPGMLPSPGSREALAVGGEDSFLLDGGQTSNSPHKSQTVDLESHSSHRLSFSTPTSHPHTPAYDPVLQSLPLLATPADNDADDSQENPSPDDARKRSAKVTTAGSTLRLTARPVRCVACCLNTCFPSERRKAEVGGSAALRRKVFDWGLLREPDFLLYCFSICLFTLSLKSSLLFLPPLVKAAGVSEIRAAYLLSISGAVDTVGRIATGWILELKGIRRFRPVVFNGFIFGICAVLFFAPSVTNFTGFGVVFSLFGFLTGAYVSQKSVILMDMMGAHRLASSFGLLCFFQGVGNLVGPPLSGVLKDTLGDYREVFFLGGGSLAVAGALMIASNVYGARAARTSRA